MANFESSSYWIFMQKNFGSSESQFFIKLEKPDFCPILDAMKPKRAEQGSK